LSGYGASTTADRMKFVSPVCVAVRFRRTCALCMPASLPVDAVRDAFSFVDRCAVLASKLIKESMNYRNTLSISEHQLLQRRLNSRSEVQVRVRVRVSMVSRVNSRVSCRINCHPSTSVASSDY